MSDGAERLSTDQAAGLLAELRAKGAVASPEEAPVAAPAVAPEAAPEQPHSEAAPTAEELPAAETPGEEVQQAPEPATPAVEPPHFWDAKAKERFAELPADLQNVVLEQWKAGERTINSRQEEAANARKAADEARQKAEAELTSASDLTKRLGEIVPKAEETFKSRWEGVNWVELAKSDPDQYVQAKALYDAEQAELQRLQSARQEAERAEEGRRVEAQRQRLQAEAEKLRTLAPDLADPKEGRARMQKLVDYLRDKGFADEDIAGASATQLAVAYDAMQLRDQRAGQPRAQPRPAVPAKPPVRPASGQGAPSPTSASQAMDRLSKTGLRDDALAVLKARRQAR